MDIFSNYSTLFNFSKETTEEIDSIVETECAVTNVSTMSKTSVTWFRDCQNLIFSGNLSFCTSTWDGISCWPTTLAGFTAHVPCFSELNGVTYDVSGNASRGCLKNATWSTWSNYRSCKPLNLPENDFYQVLWDMKDATTIYYIGYGFSLVVLALALWIFIHFKDLRCLRNTIHVNLMLTYLLIDITWILTGILQTSYLYVTGKVACVLVILLTYLMGTNFFWMFVEGLYLYILVVKTFSVDNINIEVYLIIGWGVPAIVTTVWAAVKGCMGNVTDDPFMTRGCPWQNRDNYDYIFICPVVFVLVINVFFLIRIMWVLITKLRATNTLESEQYRKAAKALFVLIPLLGVTYILVIATPSDRTAEVIFTYIQAALLSIQGFIVAVLYCFLNGEVQNSFRHHLERRRMRKTIHGAQYHPTNCHRSSQQDECFRLYEGRGVRDSCASFTTSTSFINLPGGRSPSGLNENPSPTNNNYTLGEDRM